MKSRYHCPACNHKKKTFSLYIDTETGEHIHPTVGRCDRESNCGYHYTPKQYFQDNKIDTPRTFISRKKIKSQHKPVSFIPIEIFKASLQEYESNHFVQFLIDLFSEEVTSELISRYFIATSKHWSGSTVFWQIDTKGKIRTGKIMLYSSSTGKRIKEPFNHITWAHSLLKRPDFELEQCLFGEHLLNDKSKPIAIVESEKTAIIASVYLPQFIWLAVGSLTNLNAKKCSVLNGRIVTLFPDLNGFEKWSEKANELSKIAIFNVSDLLERKASEEERRQGLDLADYLIKFDYRDFVFKKSTIEKPQILHSQINFIQPQHVSLAEDPKPKNWNQEINVLESFFENIQVPNEKIKLDKCSTIIDVSKFIDSHFSVIKANNGKRAFLPHLNRLQELKKILIINLN